MNSDINNIFYNTDVSVLSLNCNQITSTNTSDTFNFLYVMKLTASSIKKLVLGDNITSIGKFSFKHLTGLTDLRMSNNVEYLGQECFYNCSKLTEITLPSTLQTIESNAFANCSSLNSIIILATTPPELVNINNADVNHIFEGSYPIYVPAESVNTYKTANGWSNYYANRIFAIQ